MDEYAKLNKLIYTYNKDLYKKLPYAWDKVETIKYLLKEIPELKTSYVKDFNKLTDFVIKDSFGHSSRNVYVFKKIGNDLYYEKLRKRNFNKISINRIISSCKKPFFEKNICINSLPYDIKVHVFFGKACFFYVYKKGTSYQKARYDKNCNYIPYSMFFYQTSFL